MKRSASLSFAVSALVLASALSGAAAPYFPYDYIEDYYKAQPEQPAAAQPPAPQQLPPPAEAQRRPGQPPAISAPPEFLFPAKLDFGVAVGVPYDMMYLDKEYYLWHAGAWYRSSTYRGPWRELGYSQLPPELRKQPLAKIRDLRNKEFKTFWKEKEGYQGKRFRPGGAPKEAGAEKK